MFVELGRLRTVMERARASFSRRGGYEVVLPINQVVLSNGTCRYWIPIKVGSTEIRAGLDTGSAGLRILQHALRAEDYAATDVRMAQIYSAGIRVEGVLGHAVVSLRSTAKQKMPVHLVQAVNRLEGRPSHPAGALPLEAYGFQGDGLAGEGFKAIIGVNMADADAPNPFLAMGFSSWMIDLPLGVRRAGKLVLNPSSWRRRGFRSFPLMPAYYRHKGGMHDAIFARLANSETGDVYEGPTLLDCGAPGVSIIASPADARPWPNGSPVCLRFEGVQTYCRMRFTIGLRSHASRMIFVRRPEGQGVRIVVGVTPYLAFRVVYDSVDKTISFKARWRRPAGIHARVGGRKRVHPGTYSGGAGVESA